MLTPTVYLDTSVINFLFAVDSPELQAATLDFFDHPVRERRYRVVLSDFVVQELEQTTDTEHRGRLLQVIREYPIELAATQQGAEVVRLAQLYLRAGVLPPKKEFDALHVAFCVVEQIEYLASWNYKHLANVNRERRITAINLQEGYLYPLRITTPFELLNDES